MEIITGKIMTLDDTGLTIAASYGNIDRAILREYDEVQIGLPDGRSITPKQRRTAYMIIGYIADWIGMEKEETKGLMKTEFIVKELQGLHKEIFSLSCCDETTAREFISFLIDFAIAHGVQCDIPLWQLTDDVNRYVYSCLINKKCAVCGAEHVDLHHVEAIGMGRDRYDIIQIGIPVISLCRICHTKAHTRGSSWLIDDIKLIPVPITIDIGKKYGLTKKNLGG